MLLKRWTTLLCALICLVVGSAPAPALACEASRVMLQMLGTRGPELFDAQASTGYLLWLDKRARVIIDAGPGTVQRFEKSGANFDDVNLILFTHFHVDHSADFIAYIKGAFFSDRATDLEVMGPSGNQLVPSAEQFVQRLLDTSRGVYPYLGSFADPTAASAYKIRAKTIPWSFEHLDIQTIYESKDFIVRAVPVHHGAFPALGYRIEVAGCVISFTGDMSGRLRQMPKLARGSDILVAHNAIPEEATGVAALLHMTPSYIGEMAAGAGVKQVLLTHLMRRTIDRKNETLQLIRQYYKGRVNFPNDLDIVHP